MSILRLGSTSRGKSRSRFGGAPLRVIATDSFAASSAPSGKTFTAPATISPSDYAFISFNDSNAQMTSPGNKWTLLKYINNSGYYGSQFTAYYGTGLNPGETFTAKGSGNLTAVTVVYVAGVGGPPQSVLQSVSSAITLAVTAETTPQGYWLCSMMGSIGGVANGVWISPPPWNLDCVIDGPAFSGSDCGHAAFAHSTDGSAATWGLTQASRAAFPMQVQFVLPH